MTIECTPAPAGLKTKRASLFTAASVTPVRKTSSFISRLKGEFL